MNLRKSNGITLIALVISIIIILIIASITVHEGSILINEAKYEDVKTNMLLIQAEITNYVEQAKFEKKNVSDLTTNGIEIDGVTLKLEDTYKEDDNGNTLYKIDTSNDNDIMNKLKLGNIDSDDYYLLIDIDNLTVDVYYDPGITNDNGDSIHLLSEILEE